jgi:tRNA(Ile)-lysidine synthase
MKKTLEDRFLNNCRHHRPQHSGGRLLVAVSGGPDSVCLLHLIHRFRDTLGITPFAAHLNHGLRGEDADADASYVKHFCADIGVPAFIDKRYVNTFRATSGLSPEEAAREVRYTFLTEAAATFGASRVATGHTASDHVETILMHLIRGCGTSGLRGLEAKGKWRSLDGKLKLDIVRPLLDVSRDETAEYCRQHSLHPRLDATNLETNTPRNRVRLDLLPQLRLYNPQIDASLTRMAAIVGDDWKLLKDEAARHWRNIAGLSANAVTLSRRELLAQPPAMRRMLLCISVEKLHGTLKDIEVRHIEEMMGLLRKPAGKRIDLPEGLIFTTDYDCYRLKYADTTDKTNPSLPDETALNIPGETVIPGWRIIAEAGTADLPGGDDVYTAILDGDKTGSNLTVRSRRRGDRFMPLGMKGTKKVSDFMIDKRIPAAERDGIPLICNENQIVWLVGHRLDERARTGNATRHFLRLRCVKTG